MRADRKMRRTLFICSAALILSAVCIAFLPVGISDIACATDEDCSAFSVIFPKDDYFQSENTTLIAANDEYLLIYDDALSAVFVRDGAGTKKYDIDSENIKNIKNVYAVGKTAFIQAENADDKSKSVFYTIDMTDPDAQAAIFTLETSAPKDNYCNFSSDGKYFYARTGLGYLSVYDENTEIALGIENRQNYYFAGPASVIAGYNGNLYVFTANEGNPLLVLYDYQTDACIDEINVNYSATKPFVGDIVFSQCSSYAGDFSSEFKGEKNIVGIDRESGEVLFTSDVVPDSFCAYGDELYSIEGKSIVVYKLKDDLSGLAVSHTISMAGSDLKHLNTPCDTVILGDGTIVVADSGNNRLGYISIEQNLTEVKIVDSKPIRLTADLSVVYALCENGKIYSYTAADKQLLATYDTNITEGSDSLVPSRALDIAFLDGLYILKEDGLYVLFGADIVTLSSLSGGKRIACGKDGEHIYVLKDDGIDLIDRQGQIIMSLKAELGGAVDIAVDYAGQISVVYPNRIEHFVNRVTAFEKTAETALVSPSSSIRANATSAYLDGESLYFTANECLIGKLDINCATKENYSFTQYVPSGNEEYYFAKLKENTVSYTIPLDGRVDGVNPAPTDTVIILNAVNGLGEEFRYALLNGNMFSIIESDYDSVQTAELDGVYSAAADTTLYALPDIEARKLEVSEGTRFSRISDCADYDGSVWMRISYNGAAYFVKAADCVKVSDNVENPPADPENKAVFGKAKATRVGGLVSVYSQADTKSTAVAQIVDGTKVEVLDEVDGFYLVRIDDQTTGYMLKDEVKIVGLTTVQIIAIVLAVFVALAGICIFIIIEVTKKKNDDLGKNSK